MFAKLFATVVLALVLVTIDARPGDHHGVVSDLKARTNAEPLKKRIDSVTSSLGVFDFNQFLNINPSILAQGTNYVEGPETNVIQQASAQNVGSTPTSTQKLKRRMDSPLEKRIDSVTSSLAVLDFNHFVDINPSILAQGTKYVEGNSDNFSQQGSAQNVGSTPTPTRKLKRRMDSPLEKRIDSVTSSLGVLDFNHFLGVDPSILAQDTHYVGGSETNVFQQASAQNVGP